MTIRCLGSSFSLLFTNLKTISVVHLRVEPRTSVIGSKKP